MNAPVGNTPVVRLRRVAPQVRLKLENRSPTGSIKDRVAFAAVEAALRSGTLSPGATLVEPSMGNTAVSLAYACLTLKVKLTAVMPDSVSLERRALLRSYGVRIELTPTEEGFAGARAKSESLPGTRLNLWDGVVARDIHTRTTARELVEQIQGEGEGIGAFLCGVGSGATFSALSEALRKVFPSVKLVRVLSTTGGKRNAEIGFLPPLNSDNSETIAVADPDAWKMKLRLGKEEGLLVGISTGANVLAATQLSATGPVYTLACDSGEREFSLAEQFK
ncbi:MAG: PLP-dependent cysteine synthase family protein [Myxococcaceae bacterium]